MKGVLLISGGILFAVGVGIMLSTPLVSKDNQESIKAQHQCGFRMIITGWLIAMFGLALPA